MEAMVELYNRIVREEEGQGMIEYALLAALISIAAIGVIIFVGPEIAEIFGRVETELGTVPAAGT